LRDDAHANSRLTPPALDRCRRSVGQRFADGLAEAAILRRDAARKEAPHRPVAADEILAEVPVRYVTAAGQEAVDRRLPRSGPGFPLREHRERDAVVALTE